MPVLRYHHDIVTQVCPGGSVGAELPKMPVNLSYIEPPLKVLKYFFKL